MQRITEKEMLLRLRNMLGDEYEVLSNTMAEGDNYHSARAKIRHRLCGVELEKSIRGIISNRSVKCRYCAGHAPIDEKEFLTRLKEVYPGDEYILVGEYKGYSIPTLFKHSCGDTLRTRPITLIKGTRKHRDCSFTVDHTEPITIGKEEWKPIPDSNYSVSNYGKVRNDGTGLIRKLTKEGNGYLRLCIVLASGEDKWESAHRLVAEAFIPNAERLPLVHHMDGNRSNNRADNLQWATYQYNRAHTL